MVRTLLNIQLLFYGTTDLVISLKTFYNPGMAMNVNVMPANSFIII